MYDRMVHEHGYSIRKLAEKLGKDKGYLENRLRLADAPDEIRQLVSLRKDTVSHAYELLKVQDPKKRKRLAAQVASGELSLVKLREKIEGRRSRTAAATPSDEPDELVEAGPLPDDDGDAANGWNPTDRVPVAMSDDSLVNARHQLSDAVEDLVSVLRAPDVMRTIPDIDRVNLAKYLTIAKLKLENAIALVRSGEAD